MAEINNININGTVYGVGNIYAKMGISYDRFVELVSRDFYTPTLSANPTSSTVRYTDTDGSENDFQVGQFARVADSTQEGGYKIWQCVSNNGTTASWVSSYNVMTAYVANAVSTLATKSELTEGLADKVDKVSGKGLSANDFTTALKTKLEGLSNYDDTALSNSITSLQNQFNALVNADADAAIDTFNEIVAFLAGLENTETLEGILADISTQISGKMDKVTLAAVATSGSYNDLSNKPTIPSALSALSDDASHRTVTDTEKAAWNAKSDFSGSYNDLTNKPTIPAAVTVDSSLSSTSTNPVQNKVINTALAGKQATISDLATIRSGASAGATAVQPSSLATVATSGSYDDLSDKPTIPTVNNATLTIQKNGTSVGTFTANASSAKAINITMSKSDVGLGNVDNTADADKSVSHAETAGSATKATQDASGNVITSTYATKSEIANMITGDGTILQIVKVSALPSSPVSTTLYVIPE